MKYSWLISEREIQKQKDIHLSFIQHAKSFDKIQHVYLFDLQNEPKISWHFWSIRIKKDIQPIWHIVSPQSRPRRHPESFAKSLQFRNALSVKIFECLPQICLICERFPTNMLVQRWKWWLYVVVMSGSKFDCIVSSSRSAYGIPGHSCNLRSGCHCH